MQIKGNTSVAQIWPGDNKFVSLALNVDFLYQNTQYNDKDRRGQRDLNVPALEENSEITESPCGKEGSGIKSRLPSCEG